MTALGGHWTLAPPLLALCSAACFACTESAIQSVGQLGRPIPLISGDALRIPRAIMAFGGCSDKMGGCVSYCSASPAQCLAEQPDACLPLLVDTGTPITATAFDTSDVAIEESCLELKAAEGLGAAVPEPSALAAAVSRFRFVDAPVVGIPARHPPANWAWRVGTEPPHDFVSGVLGGNVLNDFAVRFRSDPQRAATISFYRFFPGDEQQLAEQGRAFLPVQYPRRLLGLVAQDRCNIAGVDCELDGVDLNPDDERLIYESTRLIVDACIAPPPCAPTYDPVTEVCTLSAGGAAADQACQRPDVGDQAGSAASLLVATGVPDMVLFADSVLRMFGPIEALPRCSGLHWNRNGDDADRACVDDGTSELHMPGWAQISSPLTRLRVRATALVPGLPTAKGHGSCRRLFERMIGLGQQCRQYASVRSPIPPDPTRSSDTGELSSLDDSLFVFGEVRWLDDQTKPDPARWIPVLVVPEGSNFVTALRRDVGSRPLQLDGLVGTALLEDTDLVVDYTEENPGPSLRISCLNPEAGRCLSVPACARVDGDTDGGPNAACCHGLPQRLLRQVIRTGRHKPAPRSEEACCVALSQAGLEDLQSMEPALCSGVDPM
ncbi:MAG: hypothetical protein V3V08_02155 [Nannocystaceae bacterium]